MGRPPGGTRPRLAQARPEEGACRPARGRSAFRAPAVQPSGVHGLAVRRGSRAGAARRPGRGYALATEHLDLARATELPRPIGMAALGLATVSPPREALPMLQEAVESLEGTPANLEFAKAVVEYGAALRRAGKRMEARDHLRRGLELAHVARRLTAGNARQEELVAAGVHARLHRDRRPDGGRAPGSPDGSDRGDEPRHRSAAVRNPEDH